MSPTRRKNNSFCYELTATDPTTGKQSKFVDINNLNELSNTININFFNSFPVVSRAMVNNWVYYPTKGRRSFGDYFKINKVSC